ncbi:glucokinase, partial [Entomortierella beljakovae]
MSLTPIASKIIRKPCRHAVDVSTIDYVSEKQKQAVHDLVEEFTVTKQLLFDIKDNFKEAMKKGLEKEGATIAMIPSYVMGRLDGTEKGSYLALDVGGTNLRVVSVSLEGCGKITTHQTKFKIDEALKIGEAKALFVDEQSIAVRGDTEFELGFTFSFPVLQTSINRGTLISWTKGFDARGMVGKDPVSMLQDAFNRRHLPVRVAALVNDTVGTLLSHAYNHPDTTMGIILGTGCNGAYIEQISNIGKWTGSTKESDMIINMEFGAFDKERAVLPLTMYDNRLDRLSV